MIYEWIRGNMPKRPAHYHDLDREERAVADEEFRICMRDFDVAFWQRLEGKYGMALHPKRHVLRRLAREHGLDDGYHAAAYHYGELCQLVDSTTWE